MGWFHNFFSLFKAPEEATPECIDEHFERIKAAPKDERKKITGTLRPDEVTQMLNRTLMYIQTQTDEATQGVQDASKEASESAKKMLATSGRFKALE